MRVLAANGLLELTWKTQLIETKQERRGPAVRWDSAAGVYRDAEPHSNPVVRAVDQRAVRLTPLGEVVVHRCRPLLESGRRIRWDAIIQSELE